MKLILIPIFMTLLFLTACKDNSFPEREGWIGKWQGVEGTFLDLRKRDDGYKIIIQNLDGQTQYDGMNTESGIEFTREGRKEVIHAGSGKETGMKWLTDKKNCLVIDLGEGYCRD